MTAPGLSSTFLNATSVPDFPGDVSAIFERTRVQSGENRHLHQLQRARVDETVTDTTSETTKVAVPDATAAVVSTDYLGSSDLQEKLKRISIVPTSRMTEDELAECRRRDPTLDKLGKIKAGLERIKARRQQRRSQMENPAASASYIDENATLVSSSSNSRGASFSKSGISTFKDGPSIAADDVEDDSTTTTTGVGAEIVRQCDQIVQKAAQISHIQLCMAKKEIWNEPGVKELLCPRRVEADIRDLEAVVSRFQDITRNESRLAVYLQQPAKPGLSLDPKCHAAAVDVLSGNRALRTASEVANAAESVEKLVAEMKSTKADYADEGVDSASSSPTDLLGEITQHIQREKNQLAHTLTPIRAAVDAVAVGPE